MKLPPALVSIAILGSILTIVYLIKSSKKSKSSKINFGNIQEIKATERDSCNTEYTNYNRVYPSGHIPGSRLIVTDQENEELDRTF